MNTIKNLGCEKEIVLKNIREDEANEKTLIELTGEKTVPVLVVDGVPMGESDKISQFLVGKFM